MAEKLGVETGGHMRVRGVFGDSRQVLLVNVEVKLCRKTSGEKVTNGKPVVCAVVPFREVTHNMVVPDDVVTDLQCLPVIDVVSEGVLDKDVSGMSVAEDTDDDSDDDVDVNGGQLSAGGCVSGETDVKQLEERDDNLSACWEVAKAGKGYLAERMGEYVQFSLYCVWLVCCTLSFCIFVYGSHWGGATVENEAIVWAFSQSGGTVCGHQLAMVCKYDLCSMCSTWSVKSLSCFLCAGVGCRYLAIQIY